MGCCSSTNTDSKPLVGATSSSANGTTANPAAVRSSSPKAKADSPTKEDQIKLALKTKRANVFTESVNTDERRAFHAKVVPKTPEQENLIRAALKQNFVFDSLNELDTAMLVNAMEIVSVSPNETVITQGEEGDYFYIIEKGSFSVTVDGKAVGKIGNGKAFGELSLVYNTPRQATVIAEQQSTLFSLARQTFKYILANNTEHHSSDVRAALHRVPILESLTDEQLDRLADAIEVVTYKPGDEIIRKGSEGSIFYMIKDGTVTVDDVGDKFKATKLGPGDYFGERALMTSEPRAATVTAETAVSILALDKESFQKLLGPLQDLLDFNLTMRVLSSIILFEKLTTGELEKLCRSFEPENFPAGTVIIRQGDRGRKFYVLISGAAKVLADDKEISDLSAGDYFGEMALLDDEVRKATVVAHTDCKCFNIDRPTFNRMLGSLQHVMERVTASRYQTLEGSNNSSSSSNATGAAAAEPQLNLKFNDLVHIAVLGSGTFGRVTLVQDKATKNVYALKALLKSEIVAHKQQENVMNEKEIMMRCNSPFVLKLFQTFKDPKKLYMLLDFVQGGELFSVVHKPGVDGVPDSHGRFYALGVLMGVAHLHSMNIAYRDMKPENCLVDKEGYPRLVDFGFAKVIVGKSFTLCGTPEYLAPELVLGRGHNKAVDYWALGVMIYEMQCGYSPYADESGNMDHVVICKNIVNGKLTFSKGFNADCKDLVRRMLVRDVQSRLGNLRGGCSDILSHPWFATLDHEAYTAKRVKAPWVPTIRGITDTSNFDQFAGDDHIDDGYVDRGTWDQNF